MRVPLELRRSYRLLNHGPVVLVSAAAGGAENVMPVAWNVPLDFEPARLALVLSAEARTREALARLASQVTLYKALGGGGPVAGPDAADGR